MIKDTAKQYISYGLQPIPLRDKGDQIKRPYVNTWTNLSQEILTPEEADRLFTKKRIREETITTVNKVTGKPERGIICYDIPKWIGIMTGTVSGELEVIDVDCKYDLTGTLWTDFLRLIGDNIPPEVKSSLVIAKTLSGGYHIYYRSEIIEGNMKLARRPTTPGEREKTYKEKLKDRLPEEKARKAGNEDKVRVLIETRGEGGYVVAPPTPGYTFIQGSPDRIPTITPEIREIILTVAKSFNTLEEVELHSTNNPSKKSRERVKQKKENLPGLGVNEWEGSGAFEDYNDKGDIGELLVNGHGWSKVTETMDRIIFKHPATKHKTSANWHKDKRTFICWSDSTVFEAERAYNLVQVYTILEHGGDYSKASQKLYEMGYGEKKTKQTAPGPEPAPGAKPTEPKVTQAGDKFYIDYDNNTLGGKIEEILKDHEGNRIYLRKDRGEAMPVYKYRLKALIDKYAEIEHPDRGLSAEDQDGLIEEAVTTAKGLNPIDRDRFTKSFIALLGDPLKLTEESVKGVIERLKYKEDKDKQAREFNAMLSEVTDLHSKGATDKAIELIEANVKKVKLTDRDTEFSSLMVPTNEGEVSRRIRSKPDSLNSGYTIGEEELLLPSGSLSIFAGPTSHGKTSLLINMALNVANKNPEKEIHFFSYEEDRDTILLNTLNSYIGEDISDNNTKSIKHYFTTGEDKYIKTVHRELFKSKKDKFFKELITPRRLNIHYTSYDSDTLIQAIRYLHEHTNVGAIFIDYIQLLNLPKGKYKTYSRQEEIKEVCIALKDIAVETGLPLILGAQFNREVVNQLRIHATKIGEAGDIERIANLIVGFWNNNFPQLEVTAGEKKEIKDKDIELTSTLYTVVLKNRGGRVGLEEVLLWNGNARKVTNRPKLDGIAF